MVFSGPFSHVGLDFRRANLSEHAPALPFPNQGLGRYTHSCHGGQLSRANGCAAVLVLDEVRGNRMKLKLKPRGLRKNCNFGELLHGCTCLKNSGID